MAEAIAVFGLAASIVQFIDFTSKIISVGYKIHKSQRFGSRGRDEVLDLELITSSLRRVANGITQSLQPDNLKRELSESEHDLCELAKRCSEVAKDLLGAVDELDLRHKSSKWYSFRQALKSVLAGDKIESLQLRLDKFRHEMVIHILSSFREHLHGSILQQSSKFDEVEGNICGIGSTFMDFVAESKKWQDGFQEDCRRWQAEIIDAIHQDKKSARERGYRSGPVLANRERQLREKLIARLRFEEMADRVGRVAEAYENTFEWIFSDPGSTEVPWTNFKQWLGSDSSLYWMTGKAGSGKSTLMKYVYHDTRTFEYLKTWAADSTLITAMFFFWNSGTKLQMSQQGLLQSILHQTLSSFPDLVPRIFPERWEAYSLFGDDLHPLGETELLQALKLLIQEETATKFCFFIDGLDEFDGDHTNLIRIIKDTTDSTNFKVCVSSRPWVTFEDAFRYKPSLMLQDLTYPDILHFTTSKFSKNEGFAELQKREPQYAKKLLEDIVQKAAGVFLWVHLVINSLLSGLVNGDRVSDLQRRLSFLPPDLEKLYQKILNSLDPFYLEHASQLFQLIRVAQEPPSILGLSFADEDPNYFQHCNVGRPGKDEILTRVNVMKRRLNSRCKGLLEVTPKPSPSSIAQSALNYFSGLPIVANLTVQYLHRTVKDFLENPKTWNRLLATRRNDYDPYLALSKSFLLQLKILQLDPSSQECYWDVVAKCLWYAWLAQPASGSGVVAVLDELDRTAGELTGQFQDGRSDGLQTDQNITSVVSNHLKDLGILQPHWTSTMYESIDTLAGHNFLSLAVSLDLHVYVTAKLKPGCLVKQDSGIWPLLADAISVDNVFKQSLAHSIYFSRRMVQILLHNGADPNWSIPNQGWTVWEKLLWQTHKEKVDMAVWLDILSQFLEHGANLGAISDPQIKQQGKIHWGPGWQIGSCFRETLQSQQNQGWFNWGKSRSRAKNGVQSDLKRLMELL